jgi:lipopolysaccharide biosynthesis regulator YciM
MDEAALRSTTELVKRQGAFAPAVELLERTVQQSTPPKAEQTLALADLYCAWAEADLNALQLEAAFTHLRAAQQIRADHFRTAKLLSQLYAERGDRKLAARTLETFLAASKDSEEREKARKLLTRVRS